jgi:hypothetical protein
MLLKVKWSITRKLGISETRNLGNSETRKLGNSETRNLGTRKLGSPFSAIVVCHANLNNAPHGMSVI